MNISIIPIWLLTLQICCGATPRLFQQQDFTAASLAEAVNHFVDLGEVTAVQELRALALSKEFPDHRTNVRIGWVCRILFDPKRTEPLRPPLFGVLSLPYRTMPLKNWPRYPVALYGSTYFVLSEGYRGGGVPEDPKDYLLYCQTNGVFRKSKVLVPSSEQALKDAAALRKSKAWAVIKWKDSGYDEESAWEFIQKQAESIR